MMSNLSSKSRPNSTLHKSRVGQSVPKANSITKKLVHDAKGGPRKLDSKVMGSVDRDLLKLVKSTSEENSTNVFDKLKTINPPITLDNQRKFRNAFFKIHSLNNSTLCMFYGITFLFQSGQLDWPKFLEMNNLIFWKKSSMLLTLGLITEERFKKLQLHGSFSIDQSLMATASRCASIFLTSPRLINTIVDEKISTYQKNIFESERKKQEKESKDYESQFGF
jgi:hypothetical protein